MEHEDGIGRMETEVRRSSAAREEGGIVRIKRSLPRLLVSPQHHRSPPWTGPTITSQMPQLSGDIGVLETECLGRVNDRRRGGRSSCAPDSNDGPSR